jgi:methylmalonyl-CoA mutase cobalamin-binding subunit
MLANINQLKLPDPWQHQAVNLLRTGTDVVVSAPTGAGKTYIFELLHQGREQGMGREHVLGGVLQGVRRNTRDRLVEVFPIARPDVVAVVVSVLLG